MGRFGVALCVSAHILLKQCALALEHVWPEQPLTTIATLKERLCDFSSKATSAK